MLTDSTKPCKTGLIEILVDSFASINSKVIVAVGFSGLALLKLLVTPVHVLSLRKCNYDPLLSIAAV